jgi:hypothetical protein
MFVLGSIGLATMHEVTVEALNFIFFAAFFPSILAGMLVYAGGRVAAALRVPPVQETAQRPTRHVTPQNF